MAFLKTYTSRRQDEQIAERVEGQDALAHAFVNVAPTKKLIRRCHRALAAAGVEPLPLSPLVPVRKKR